MHWNVSARIPSCRNVDLFIISVRKVYVGKKKLPAGGM